MATAPRPPQFNEHEMLEVSRRIEREQGSIYRINGREVRARDVQILFADASTGARSPALVHQGRIGEIIQAKPEQRRRVLEEAAGISGLHARRHEAELRLRAAEQNLARLEDVIGQLAGQIDALKRQARQAIRYRDVVGSRCARPRRRCSTCAGSTRKPRWPRPSSAKDLGVREVAERTGAQAEAAKRQAIARRRTAAAARGRGARRRRAAAAGRSRARRSIARKTRAKERIAELDRRLAQLDRRHRARARSSSADAEAALARLDAEDARRCSARREAGASSAPAPTRASPKPTRCSAAPRRPFGELTGALADLTARRNQLEARAREHDERLGAARARSSPASRPSSPSSTPAAAAAADLAALAGRGRGRAGARSPRRKPPRCAPRPRIRPRARRSTSRASRSPRPSARAQRLETEAKTLAKLLHVDAKNLWPPVIDDLTVAKGYETALGAALGDDLDAPVDPTAPMRWAGAGDRSGRSGAAGRRRGARRSTSTAPPELARRLAQIGVVDARRRRAPARRCSKPGQRLVSRDGDLWRWDGFAVAANAPTGAARRLAERNRLADIEAELEQRARRGRQPSAGGRAPAEAEVARGRRGRDRGPRRAGASCSARPTPRASATPPPSARSAATPRAARR